MSKMSDLIKGFRYNVKHGYQTTLIHTPSDGRIHLTSDNVKGYVGIADNPLTHSMVTIYQDPITKLKPEGKACLLHKIADLPDDLERWQVCFEGDDGAVYERTIKIN